MSDATVASDRRRSTPWPLAAAVGVAASEVGVFLGLFAVAVIGLGLFGASVAGLLTETGHVARPWPALAAVGLVLAGAGLLVGTLYGGAWAAVLRAFGTDPVRSRALSVVAGGVVLTAAGVVAAVVERTGATDAS